MSRILVALFSFMACFCAPPPAWAVSIPTVPVGNAGNPGEVQSQGTFGAVAYDYRIGTTEVTNAQYAEFLNAKAASDPLALYDVDMGDSGSGVRGGITRSGTSGSFTYAAIAGRENLPVNHVTWYDAIRFVNWLHNGQGSGDTETGAYTLLGGTSTPSNGSSISRNVGATWFLPSEDEWYKAAYHQNDGVTGNYYDFPNSSDAIPVDEPPPGGINSANYSNPSASDLTDAGAYATSVSPYGTFDQGGNVWEWNEDLFGGTNRVLRGGSFETVAPLLSAAQRTQAAPLNSTRTLGFRVATVPEPSTAVLACLGLLVLGVTGWPRTRKGQSGSL